LATNLKSGLLSCRNTGLTHTIVSTSTAGYGSITQKLPKLLTVYKAQCNESKERGPKLIHYTKNYDGYFPTPDVYLILQLAAVLSPDNGCHYTVTFV
jgi:hypothetical protein